MAEALTSDKKALIPAPAVYVEKQRSLKVYSLFHYSFWNFPYALQLAICICHL